MRPVALVFSATALLAAMIVQAGEGKTISAEEAYRRASAFFGSVIGCGALDESPTDMGESWAFTARVGYAAERDPSPVLVDKRSGKVSWVGHEGHRSVPQPDRPN